MIRQLCIISFSSQGIKLSASIAAKWQGEVKQYTKCSTATFCERQEAVYTKEPLQEWTRQQFQAQHAILFIGACGIAVRAIAPYLQHKLQDPPVLVADDTGAYVIPILSGHAGGANALAKEIAAMIGAQPVLTTATDRNHKFAVDVFAQSNQLTIVNCEGIAGVSAKVLAGKEITMSIAQDREDIAGQIPQEIRLLPYPPCQRVDVLIAPQRKPEEEALLWLQPKQYCIGIGCRRGILAEEIAIQIEKGMQETGITLHQIALIASIDKKKEEPGILQWSKTKGVPFVTYTVQELMEVAGVFHDSAFVLEQVGIANVCERAALRACGGQGRLVYEKHAENAITVAVAKREWRITFEEL